LEGTRQKEAEDMSLEQSIKQRLAGEQPERPGEPRSKERRVSEVVAKMSPAQREALYDEIVRQGWEE
jgi:hypothetical protein